MVFVFFFTLVWPDFLSRCSQATNHQAGSVLSNCERSPSRGECSGPAQLVPAWRPTLPETWGSRGRPGRQSWESHLGAQPDSGPPACERQDFTPRVWTGAELGLGAWPAQGRGRPGKTETPAEGWRQDPDPGFHVFRSGTSGVGGRENPAPGSFCFL